MLRTFGLAAIAVAAIFCCKSQAATVLTSVDGFTNTFPWHFSLASEGQHFDAKLPRRTHRSEVLDLISFLSVNEKDLPRSTSTGKRDGRSRAASNESNRVEHEWVSAAVLGYMNTISDVVMDQESVQSTQP